MQTLAEQQAAQMTIGYKLVEILNLKQVKDNDGHFYNPPRYNTSYGTKTAIGLYLTVQRIMAGE